MFANYTHRKAQSRSTELHVPHFYNLSKTNTGSPVVDGSVLDSEVDGSPVVGSGDSDDVVGAAVDEVVGGGGDGGGFA